MGLTKTEQFTEEQNNLAAMTKALAHPARIAILQYLLSTGACITKDIVDELPLAQPTISQHLKELKKAGLVKGTIEGTSICYCIDEVEWRKVQTQINEFFNTVGRKCC
ncbi:MAG: metalloregulator ArsR/SmtB family transcription factor [Bacteroidota bacterium]